MSGTRFPNGFKDKNNNLITSDLTTAEQTSAADDSDHTKIVADIATLVGEINKQKAIIEKLLGE